jgi:ABC-type glycerol-3-phosphate transport system permease component
MTKDGPLTTLAGFRLGRLPIAKKVGQQGINHALAILICLAMYAPVHLIVVNSLKDRTDARSMSIERPTTLHWENYSTVIEQANLGRAFLNSVL